MKKCPYCNKKFDSVFSGDIRRHVRRCGYCGKVSKKKVSLWLVALLFIFAVVGANFKTHWLFAVFTIILALIICFIYWRLPYVPYDEQTHRQRPSKDKP